jgi:potassium voltage-gated channel Shal-related subfamily D protein 2
VAHVYIASTFLIHHTTLAITTVGEQSPRALLNQSLTSVGYGEIVPRSFLGRLITLPLLLSGLLLIALPSFVLGREFSLAWAELSEGRVCVLCFSTDGCWLMFARLKYLGAGGAVDVTELSRQDTAAYLPAPRAEQDLSNRKLAGNQAELSRQISELRHVVAAQNALIQRVLEQRLVSPDE